jgi:hypothetical protein
VVVGDQGEDGEARRLGEARNVEACPEVVAGVDCRSRGLAVVDDGAEDGRGGRGAVAMRSRSVLITSFTAPSGPLVTALASASASMQARSIRSAASSSVMNRGMWK